MGGVFEFLAIVVILGVLAMIVVPRLRNRGPGGGGFGGGGARGAGLAHGTLLVTGLSPRPADAEGEQFVTITGVINGPTVNEHVVYQQMAVDVNAWPTMGQLIPVVYSPKNPDKWGFAPPEQPDVPYPDGPPPPPPYQPPPPPPSQQPPPPYPPPPPSPN